MNENTVKLLNNPYGQVSYETFRADRRAFADKSAIIQSLDKEDMTPYPVLLRPRRFGKSLLVSVFESLFSNCREYFKGLAIENDDYWKEEKTYKVVHLDFSSYATEDLPGFKLRLNMQLLCALTEKTIEELSKGKSEILSAVNVSADSVIKAVEEMFAKANDDREKAAECDRLKSRLSESEKKITEQESIITELREKNSASVSKCEGAIKKSEELEAQNAELEEKLREAYSINSREESLEAEKIRSELKKAFMYLYEDWLDYEFSDVSEENYESLQAIIKKIFRVLERNGIDFKEK